jgi:hypothetical protein
MAHFKTGFHCLPHSLGELIQNLNFPFPQTPALLTHKLAPSPRTKLLVAETFPYSLIAATMYQEMILLSVVCSLSPCYLL